MKFRAIAVASERTDNTGRAVGTVELECTPEGLSVVYSGVGSFNEGYAPGPLTTGTSVLAPWSQVLEAQFEGERLFLSLDPALSPHHRLLLSTFRAARRCTTTSSIGVASWSASPPSAAAVITALLGFALVIRLAPERGPALSIVIATLAAGAVLTLSFFADRLLVFGGEATENARHLLAGELASHLPRLLHVPEPAKPPRAPRTLAQFQGLLPRTTFAIVVTLAASGLGTVLMARYLIQNEPEPQPIAHSARDARPAHPNPTKPSATRRACAAAPARATPRKPLQRPRKPLWLQPRTATWASAKRASAGGRIHRSGTSPCHASAF